MKRVLAMGTFDGVHPGHVNYLEQAKKCGDYLIVVVARDGTVEEEKGKRPVLNEEERLEEVKNVGVVDEAVLGNIGDKLKIVEETKPDVICLGYDQKVDAEKLREELMRRGLEGVVIKRMKSHYPEKYKSSLLRKR